MNIYFVNAYPQPWAYVYTYISYQSSEMLTLADILHSEGGVTQIDIKSLVQISLTQILVFNLRSSKMYISSGFFFMPVLGYMFLIAKYLPVTGRTLHSVH